MNEEQKPKIPWWQPGMQLFLKLSAWIGGPVLVAVFFGRYLDRKFHSEPWLFLLTVGSSFVFSIMMIVKIGMKEMEKENQKSK